MNGLVQWWPAASGTSWKREPVRLPRAQFEAEWIAASDHPTERVILYLPGGAYVLRTPNLHTGMVSRLCRSANARALMTYYRLAPEFPFPACLEDSMLAYRWLLENGPQGPAAAAKVWVAGDSAGGNLTLSLVAWVRDAGLRAPDGAVALSPLTDATLASPSLRTNVASDPMLGPHAPKSAESANHVHCGAPASTAATKASPKPAYPASSGRSTTACPRRSIAFAQRGLHTEKRRTPTPDTAPASP